MADPSPPHVHLKRFSGLPNENWPEFEGLLRASIAVSRIPQANHQRARYLHLHLAGNALNYYLRLAKNTRNDLDDSLEQLRFLINKFLVFLQKCHCLKNRILKLLLLAKLC